MTTSTHPLFDLDMAKYIDADKLRAEIESYRKECEDSYGNPGDNNFPFGKVTACREIIEIIDSLQQEDEQEVDLGKIIEQTYHDGSVADTDDMDHVTYENIARHFYELGKKDAANKFDEIEYNRQRAEEEMSDKTLDEAAEKGAYNYCVRNKIGESIGAAIYDAYETAFKAGAEWMAGQGAQLIGRIKVNGIGQPYLPPDYIYLSGLELKEGDKVIVQIRKKEERK